MMLQIATALAIGAYVVLSKDAQPGDPGARPIAHSRIVVGSTSFTIRRRYFTSGSLLGLRER
jgi:hypothetical protein